MLPKKQCFVPYKKVKQCSTVIVKGMKTSGGSKELKSVDYGYHLLGIVVH